MRNADEDGAPPCRIDRATLAVVLPALLGFAYVLVAPVTLDDGDTYWHLATGRWILANGAVPRVDPFSYSAAGRPWIAHEWLSDVVMTLAWRFGGWGALIALTAAAFAALLAIVGAELRRWLSPSAVAATLFLLAATLMPALLARPHVLAMPLLSVWVAMLLRARERGEAPSPGWAVLMLVWANAHGSFMSGLALAAAMALDALVDAAPADRPAIARGWARFGLLSGCAALATPGGLDGFLYPFHVSRLALLPYIEEWRPVDIGTDGAIELTLLVGLFLVLVRPVRIAPVRLLLLLGALHLALAHVRQVSVFAIVATLLLAEPVARAWGDRADAPPAARAAFGRRAAALALVSATLLAGVRIAIPVIPANRANVPATAIAWLAAHAPPGRVFNEYGFGGPLILAGIEPFIDGRSDMYGDRFSISYFRMMDGDHRRWRIADRRWRFGWTMLVPTNRLVARLDADPAWRRVYTDRFAVIHVRRAARPAR